MSFVKVHASILDSSVWLEDDKTRIVWFTLMAMADRDGVVEASVPGLAHRARVPRRACELALQIFMEPDPDSRTPDHDGRRIEKVAGGWRLINYEPYREKDSAEQLREKNADRQQRFRDRHRDVTLRNVTSVTVRDNNGEVTSPSASASVSASESPDPEEAPRRTITAEIEPVTVADRPTDLWSSHRWLARFTAAWEARAVPGTAFYADTGDSKACETLTGELARLPLALRLLVQTEAPRMFAAFFAEDNPKTIQRHHPFIFFVQEFGALRQRGTKLPAGKPLPPSTPDLRR